jgi:hypothetical protein
LFPYLGYWKQRFCELGVQTSLCHTDFNSHSTEGLLNLVILPFLIFWGTPYCSPYWLTQFTFPSAVYKGSLFSTPSPTFIISWLFNNNHSHKCGANLTVVLICSSLMTVYVTVLIGHLYVFFEKIFIQVHCLFFN